MPRTGRELRLLTQGDEQSGWMLFEDLAGGDGGTGDLRQAGGASLRARRGVTPWCMLRRDYRLWVRNPEEMHAANVATGRGDLLRLAREVGDSAKVVYTSSRWRRWASSRDGTIVDEATPVALWGT